MHFVINFVLYDTLAECAHHIGVTCKYACLAVNQGNGHIVYHLIANCAARRGDLKVNFILHSLHILTLCKHLVNGAAHEECLLGKIVAIAAEDCLEAANRILHLDILAGQTGEVFRNMERL